MNMVLERPSSVEARLEQIDTRLEALGDELEQAAKDWFTKKREREQEWATAYVQATGGHSERKAAADKAASHIGVEEEAAWEGKRAVLKTLETRSMIGSSLLKLQTRLGA